MSKIKFRIEAWGSVVLFQILEMDERFRRNWGKPNYTFQPKDGLTVVSCENPELRINEIYLRGTVNGMDGRVASLTFETKKDAEDYCQKVVNSLRDWARNWEGWGNEEIETDDDIPNVYEF